MRKLIIFLSLIFTLNSYSQIKNGYYYGETTIKKGKYKCYYKNTLIIRNDSIYLSKSPKCIVGKDTCDAAADYVYSQYAGLISNNGNKMYISTFLTGCEYCIFVDSPDSSINSLGLITYRLYKRGDYLIFDHDKYKYFPDKLAIVKKFDFNGLFKPYKIENVDAIEPEKIDIIEDK
jgi:hypothetical protein